jgi:fumarate reductase subunit D
MKTEVYGEVIKIVNQLEKFNGFVQLDLLLALHIILHNLFSFKLYLPSLQFKCYGAQRGTAA